MQMVVVGNPQVVSFPCTSMVCTQKKKVNLGKIKNGKYITARVVVVVWLKGDSCSSIIY